ncbi:MAG: hypothetical protein Q4A16_00345 [Lautropia sp.]|nr:hypothetical protein [Lautropia sp.]
MNFKTAATILDFGLIPYWSGLWQLLGIIGATAPYGKSIRWLVVPKAKFSRKAERGRS